MAEDIVAFLRARYDERERAALFVLSDYAHHEASWSVPSTGVVDIGDGGIADETILTGDGPLADFIADNDPEFVLADVVAKRQIVWEHGDNGMFKHDDNGDLVRAGPLGDRCTSCLLTDDPLAAEAGSEFAEMAPYPCRTLRLLAQPYAGHPEFREEWTA